MRKKNHSLEQIAAAHHAIRQEEALAADSIGYYPRVLCQIALPASRFAGNEYERTSGNYHLSVQAPRAIGVPWGIYPRGTLAWLAAEVVRRKNQELDTRTIHLGKSLAEFIQKVSGTASSSGGATGNIRGFKMQLASLLASRIFYWYEKSKEGIPVHDSLAFKSMEVASSGNLLWHPQQPGLFQSSITLGEAFHQDILDHAVPVDERALRALWPACLPTDIYVWLTYRAFAMQKQRRTSLTLSWLMIKQQFGPEYTTMRSFRQHFLLALRKVKLVYTDMDFAEQEQGIAFTLKRPSIRSVPVQFKIEKGSGG